MRGLIRLASRLAARAATASALPWAQAQSLRPGPSTVHPAPGWALSEHCCRVEARRGAVHVRRDPLPDLFSPNPLA